MDEIQLKQIGTWFILVLGAFGTAFLELIHGLNISFGWITFLGTTWYAIDYIIAVVIYFYFKVKKEGLKWEIKSLMIGIGIGILVIIGAFGVLVIEWINNFGFSLTWTAVLSIVYYATEGLGVLLIIHYLKIPVEDVPILTEVKGNPLNDLDLPLSETIPENEIIVEELSDETTSE
jgi:hypothetical protein